MQQSNHKCNIVKKRADDYRNCGATWPECGPTARLVMRPVSSTVESLATKAEARASQSQDEFRWGHSLPGLASGKSCHVRCAPKATELLRRQETTRCATSGHSNRPIGAARDLRIKRVRKSQNRVKFTAGGFGCFARLALYSSTAFNTGPITHSYCAPMLYSSRGSNSILNTLG